MSWHRARLPRRPEILQLRLDALDVQTHRAAAGEYQRHVPLRILGRHRLELHGKEIEYLMTGLEIDAADLGAEHALEPQGRLAPRGGVRLVRGQCRGPIEPVHDRREPPFARHERHVPDLQHRVLQMGRHDLEVIGIESDEFQGAQIRWSAHLPRHGSARLGRCFDRDRYPPPRRRATGRKPISG